jgi:hypothetical protein
MKLYSDHCELLLNELGSNSNNNSNSIHLFMCLTVVRTCILPTFTHSASGSLPTFYVFEISKSYDTPSSDQSAKSRVNRY